MLQDDVAPAFLGLTPTHNPTRWVLPVAEGVTGGRGQLFGGCALGAAIVALEALTGRPLAWATCQYLANSFPPDVVDLDLKVAVTGHNVTQARAFGHVGDREIFAVLAALGDRPYPDTGRWVDPPEVAAPESCPPRPLASFRDPGGLHARIDQRVAWGRCTEDGEFAHSPDGRIALWMRLPDELTGTAMGQAVVGDMLPTAVRAALGKRTWGSSLDNTVRIHDGRPRSWVLADMRVEVVAHGMSVGTCYLWSQEGDLLGQASQTTTVKDDATPGPPR